MNIHEGEWEIVSAESGALGFSHSLFYDHADALVTSCKLKLRDPFKVRRRHVDAHVAVTSLSRINQHEVEFLGAIRSWNGLACSPYSIRGVWSQLQAGGIQGECRISTVQTD